ncbi:MAG: mCpol domain-containing protein [Pseudomonadota bacterium]
MSYISIDGDDIGRRIAAMHLANDEEKLSAFVLSVQDKVAQITQVLDEAGYTIVFSAADGVVGRSESFDLEKIELLYNRVVAIGGTSLTFSAGVGQSLREAYVALLAAKSNGKARICSFSEMN